MFQENQALKEENRKLQSEIDAESMYPFRESVRWKKSEDGEDGPFCPICFAKEKMLMPLILASSGEFVGTAGFLGIGEA